MNWTIHLSQTEAIQFYILDDDGTVVGIGEFYHIFDFLTFIQSMKLNPKIKLAEGLMNELRART